MTARLEVLRPGALTTVQDLGRRGWAHLGVPRSGALDQPALVVANRLVGNPPGAAGLESTLSGCLLRARGALTVAVTGAAGPVRVDGRPAPWGAPVRVPDGAEVEWGTARAGVRGYLAVAGGLAVAEELGSRSTDLLSGLGPEPLRAGDTLPVGTAPVGRTGSAGAADWSGGAPLPLPEGAVTLRLRLGPRHDWFTPEALRTLGSADYRVSSASNRIGLRTEGPALERCREGELPSEGMVWGAVQVPPDGRPIVFLADHPTTGGYPVVGVVVGADLPLAAQAAPGVTVRFAPTGS
ncbi:biotin-dependent carboxyltransferase family protein [Streptomyces sp. NPDC005438]|uniref:5-oxoprolinase subunit C family protein n=1 Tax=Streptomyces sp. NPDC005438 TaxID=3156880 RepID=UPI0033AC3218